MADYIETLLEEVLDDMGGEAAPNPKCSITLLPNCYFSASELGPTFKQQWLFFAHG
jgi:hypothetical protein